MGWLCGQGVGQTGVWSSLEPIPSAQNTGAHVTPLGKIALRRDCRGSLLVPLSVACTTQAWLSCHLLSCRCHLSASFLPLLTLGLLEAQCPTGGPLSHPNFLVSGEGGRNFQVDTPYSPAKVLQTHPTSAELDTNINTAGTNVLAHHPCMQTTVTQASEDSYSDGGPRLVPQPKGAV